ncbi:hypothetical protein LSM04_002501 [Trypanosoma melophagium]|uniref:uncharacterized protein n=1 Tax=Trypanosoma melophagium TaxID=715481 RepID=UPI00351A9B8E|nr:hypothetical protein LSM04_002501 [Trypanosoma melophagium]
MMRDGVTHCTRWLSPTMAFRHTTNTTSINSNRNTNINGNRNTTGVSGVVPGEKSDGISSSDPPSLSSPSTIQVEWPSINTAAFNVHFRYLVGRDVDQTLDRG